MKRLVYTPRVDAYVKADDGIFDISPFILRGELTRKVNEVSTTKLTLRNPSIWDSNLNRSRLAFTEHYTTDSLSGTTTLGPMFHPMDPIVVTLTRLRDRPIQVLTGYVDSAPYVQLFPGECQLEASCTLKRLQYTYFDPGLPFFHDFLKAHNWEVNEALGGIVSQESAGKKFSGVKGLTDASFGALLFDTLTEVGTWPENSIYIENLPDGIAELVAQLFNTSIDASKQANKEFTDLLTKIIGTSKFTGGGTSSSTTTGTGDWVTVGATVDDATGGPLACGKYFHGGMSYAELGVAGRNGGLSKTGGFLSDIFKGGGKRGFGLPCGFKIEVRLHRRPDKTFTITKADNGSGIPGSDHFKVDLERHVATLLGFNGKEDIDIRPVP